MEIGTALIHIPFTGLGVVINATIYILSDPVPSVLSMKDMIDNNLVIYILERVIKRKERTQDIAFENHFLLYRWLRSDTPCSLYTYKEQGAVTTPQDVWTSFHQCLRKPLKEG